MKARNSQKESASKAISTTFSEIGNSLREMVQDSWMVRLGLTTTIAITVFFLWAELCNMFTTQDFMPHGNCLLWLPDLVILYVGSDSLIGCAYVAISATLIYLVYTARRTIPFQWIFIAFGVFIIACGTTHFLDVVTLWIPVYWLLGTVKMLTALASVTTALALPALIPRILTLLEMARVSNERKRQLEQAHSELEALYEKSQELDGLKTAFFANVSHELRTPLTLILGPTQRLLTAQELPEDQRHRLEVVQRNAMTLLKHVNDLLSLAQLEVGQMHLHAQEIDLAQLFISSAADFEELAQNRRLTFTVEGLPSLPAFLDAEKIQCICLNLLSNAFKFTPPGGSVRYQLLQKDGYAVIKVQDSGPGIKPELRGVIFERFRQGEDDMTRRFGGTGLGLAIVKEYAELHGGMVTVSTAEEGGACFTVELPFRIPVTGDAHTTELHAHEDAMLSPSVMNTHPTFHPVPAETLPHQAPGDTSNIQEQRLQDTPGGENTLALALVVEDNSDMASFLVDILAAEYRVVLAHDGLDGLEKALIMEPDIVLCDIMMPRLDGEQFVTQIRTCHNLDTIPIVVLSARADDALRVQLLREGIQEYLVKPFFPEELLVRMRNLLTIKQTRQVLQQEVADQNQNLVILAREVALRKRESQEALIALQRANKQLAHASEVQRNFVAIVSHEFRTALTSIQGFTDLMRSETFTKEEVQECATDIHGEAQRLGRMIADLLDLERMKSGRMTLMLEAVDLNSLIREITGYLRPVAPGYSIGLHLDNTQLLCQGDRDKLAQVITNLLNNAIKYSPGGGNVLVKSHAEHTMAQVSVEDNGIGIPADALEEVFTPYCRLEAGSTRYIKGTGLGLSIVRQIIEMHGGHIWVESQHGHGSKFSFTIPLAESG